MKNILITGGAGYVGTILTPRLLKKGYKVIVYDSMYFGNHLPQDPNLTVIKADIRDSETFKLACKGVDVVLHLACISNDPSFEMDEELSKSINFDCFEDLVVSSKSAGVKRFVYCSSSSVYGVSDQKNVREDHPLVPLTLYNKFKGLCEPILFKHKSKDFVCVTIRPATLCGYSPRMRFDLSVNILTNHAINNNKITVFGGSQLRPNLHIKDMCSVYELMIEASSEKIQGEIFNVGYENKSIMDLAKLVKKVVLEEFPEKRDIEIITTSSDDLRSYHINSDKIKKVLDFSPKYTIENAVWDLCRAFKEEKFEDSLKNVHYVNVRYLKERKVV